jgi:hypothetical protein
VVFIPTQQEIGKLCTSMQQLQGTWYCHRSLGNMEHRTLKQDRTTSITYADVRGSMFWSQFSAIFANFRRKNWRFSHKPLCYDQIFAKSSSCWSKKTPILSPIFSAKIFLKS